MTNSVTGAQQITDMLAATETFSKAHGSKVLVEFETNARLLLEWVRFLKKHSLTGTADELLQAVSSSIRESAAFAVIGAVRPCLFSLRAQTDLLLSWLYFKDHPVEYSKMCRTGEGYILKKEALKYFSDFHDKYPERYGGMLKIMTRQQQDPYKLLSAHIHAQSPFVIPEVRSLKDVVRSEKLVMECMRVQFEVAEFLSDILFSLQLFSFGALPQFIQTSLMQRIKTDAQKRALL